MSTVSQGKKHRDYEAYLYLDEHFIIVSFWTLLAASYSWGCAFLSPPPNVVFSTAFYSVTFEAGFRKVGNSSLQWDGREKQCHQITDWNVTTKGWSQQEEKRLIKKHI